jgi:DNA-binding GntR family transcriptional regulator
MRIALEAVAIRLTVPTLTSEDFAELEGLMAQMDHYMRQNDQRRMDVPHSAFHARLVGAAGPRVATTLKQLFDHAQRYRLAYGAMAPGGYEGRRAEHRAILDSAAAGDAGGAAEHLAHHYMQTAMLVIRQLEPEHDAALLRTTLETVAPRAAAAAA